MSCYDTNEDNENTCREPIGWCAYSKDPIFEGDPVVSYKGRLYHRDNFLQASLGTKGEFIDAEEEE